MKILLDMNLSVVWEEFLLEFGHEAVHWSQVGDVRAEDAAIMEWARTNDYCVLTHDLDSGSLLSQTQAKGPSVIQIRVQHLAPESARLALLERLTNAKSEIESGALVTIEPSRYRIRILPFGVK